MSFIPTISGFYEDSNKIAVHFHNASNYSRNIIYSDLGFETFVALDGTNQKPTQLEFNGANASDKSTYFAIESQLNDSSPQFFSVITMQNHIPWEKADPSDIIASGPDFSKEENETLTQYARLMKDTDTQTHELLEKLSTYEKKITVLFYGDHLPGLYPSSIFKTNPNLQFETDYFIWSNYPTEKLDYPYVNSSDFPALVLKQTNSKVSPYYALLTKVLDLKDRFGKEERVSQELKLIEYDLILGKGYLLDDKTFFSIPND